MNQDREQCGEESAEQDVTSAVMAEKVAHGWEGG
jgi:hypothetical protein